MATFAQRRKPLPSAPANQVAANPLYEAGYVGVQTPTGIMYQSPQMAVLNPMGLDGMPMASLGVGGAPVMMMQDQALQQQQMVQQNLERNQIEAQRLQAASEYARRTGATSAPYLTTGGEARQQDPSRPIPQGFNPYGQGFASPSAREGSGLTGAQNPVQRKQTGFGESLARRKQALRKSSGSTYNGFGGPTQ